jgi:hypothetical protein
MRVRRHGAIGVCELLHHVFARQQPGNRCPAIAPLLPSLVRPILRASAIGRSRVKMEGLKQQRVFRRGVGSGNCIILVALGETRQGIRLARVRAFLIPNPRFG